MYKSAARWINRRGTHGAGSTKWIGGRLGRQQPRQQALPEVRRRLAARAAERQAAEQTRRYGSD
jgi:hypothetical protein